jgi:hypothetical protein
VADPINLSDAPGPPMRCAVCGLPLDQFRSADGEELTYIHSRPVEQDDHIAVPVAIDEIVGASRCDFCDSPEDEFIVLAESFQMPYQGAIGGQLVDQNSSGNWAACAPCKNLVERRAWGQLVTRVKQNAPAQARSIPRKVYLALYEELDKHITGIVTLQEWIARGRPGM